MLTALLGQCYASLSGNHNIRATSRKLRNLRHVTGTVISIRSATGIWHALGFKWAEECSLHVTQEGPTGDPPATPEELLSAWRDWAAQEMQRRAVLGHYILDGNLCALNQQAAAVRHIVCALTLGCSDAEFRLQNPADWAALHFKHRQTNSPISTSCITLRTTFAKLFSPGQVGPCHYAMTTILALMEGLQTVLFEQQQFGLSDHLLVPSSNTVEASICEVFSMMNTSLDLNDVERRCLLIRWHALCIDLMCGAPVSNEQLARPGLEGSQERSGASVHRPLAMYQYRGAPSDRCALLHALSLLEDTRQVPPAACPPFVLAHSIFIASKVLMANAVRSSPHAVLSSAKVDLATLSWSTTPRSSLIVTPQSRTDACAPSLLAECRPQSPNDSVGHFVKNDGIIQRHGIPIRIRHEFLRGVGQLRQLGLTFPLAKELGRDLDWL